MLINKSKKQYLKYILSFLCLITILFWPESFQYIDDQSLINDEYNAIIQKYQFIKKGEQSELKELFLAVINDRLKCYFNTSDYSLRLQNCRKEYAYQILRTARENLKSSPSLGEFMLCIQDCPLSYSFCNGEESSGTSTQDCREIEALCIERCLDAFWRGNSLSDTQ
ncbi:MAG: hypothetical protein HQK67_07425 [Desulfamplus sp.]|nr:hypothetical protein [Desulfamplus sp.]